MRFLPREGCFSPLRFWASLVLQLALAVGLLGEAKAASVSVQWNASSGVGVTGYKIYYGTSSGNLSSSVTVGSVTQYTISGLNVGQIYYFAVSAIASGGESDATNPVSISIPGTPTPTPTATPPASGADSDGDGLSDSDEATRGTNPLLADSDNDGVNDSQEVIDGTNPLDQGSGESGLGTRVCTEWNGFLGGLWNILELINLGNQSLQTQVILYSQSGEEVNRQVRIISPGEQTDILIHELSRWRRNSYGSVCVEHNGSEGDLDGRMVYYKPSTTSSTRTFEFAFAMPFARGKKGTQFVPFNTYQPSFRSADRENLVANWVQLTNLSDTIATGRLSFYGLDGAILNQINVHLRGGARQDFSAHDLGRNLAGFVRWEPNDATLPFQLRNVRYLYDNRFGRDSFNTAFQLEGTYPTGELQSVPVSTENRSAIIEVSNVLGEQVSVLLNVYNEAGVSVQAFAFPLAANASLHFILDSYLGAGRRGTVTVSANKRSSIMAVAMHYARDQDRSVNTMYGIPLRPAFGTVLRGSYNTFIGQQSQLLLVNPTSSTKTATIDMRRSTGELRLSGYSVSVPANGARTITLNQFESTNSYGVVTVHAPSAQSIVAWVVRAREGEFAMPVPVRE